MLKPPSPVSETTLRFRADTDLGTDAARHAVADRGKAAVGHEVAAGLLGVEHQPAPMAGEAAIGNENRIIGHDLVQFAHQAADVDRGFGALHAVARRRPSIRPCALGLRQDRRRASAARAPLSASAAASRCECEAGIADEANVGAGGAADLLGDDVDVNERFAGRDQREALGCDLAELAADHEQAIRPLRSARWRCGRSGRTGPLKAGCEQAIAPLPVMVWATGMPWLSAKFEQAS